MPHVWDCSICTAPEVQGCSSSHAIALVRYSNTSYKHITIMVTLITWESCLGASYILRMISKCRTPWDAVCCLLPGLCVDPRKDHDFTSHQWDCQLSKQQEGGTHGYISTENSQGWVRYIEIMHPGMLMLSPYLLTSWKRRWTTISLFSWVSQPQWCPPDRRGPTGQGEERKLILCSHGSCGLAGTVGHGPTMKHPTLPMCSTARTPHWGSAWPSGVVLKGNQQVGNYASKINWKRQILTN